MVQQTANSATATPRGFWRFATVSHGTQSVARLVSSGTQLCVGLDSWTEVKKKHGWRRMAWRWTAEEVISHLVSFGIRSAALRAYAETTVARKRACIRIILEIQTWMIDKILTLTYLYNLCIAELTR